MEKEIVFFRGRSTAGILADARVTILCSISDALAMPGDVEFPKWVPFSGDMTDLVIIANGGPTGPLASTLLRACEEELRD